MAYAMPFSCPRDFTWRVQAISFLCSPACTDSGPLRPCSRITSSGRHTCFASALSKPGSSVALPTVLKHCRQMLSNLLSSVRRCANRALPAVPMLQPLPIHKHQCARIVARYGWRWTCFSSVSAKIHRARSSSPEKHLLSLRNFSGSASSFAATSPEYADPYPA